MRCLFVLLLFFHLLGCAQTRENIDEIFFKGEDFYKENNQKNKFFIVHFKNIDYLTPEAVLSLRVITDVKNIPDYFVSLCEDYDWMNSKKVIHIFENAKYAEMYELFIGKTERTMMKDLPREKYVAAYNPAEFSITFFPLIHEKRKKIYLDKEWCKK